MKRFITVLMALVAATGSISAQKTLTSKQGYEIPANEISISYGKASYPQCALLLGGVLGAAFTVGHATLDKCSSIGAIGIEYYRHVHPNVAVGASVSYEAIDVVFSTNDVKQPDQWHHFATVMPAVKFPWFSYPHVSMYSKFAAGVLVSYIPEYTTVDSSNNESVTPASTNASVAFQVSPVCVEFGGTRSRGFVESGFGVNGVIAAGYRYCF